MSPSHDPFVIRNLLSDERFTSYVTAAGGDQRRAVELYTWNAALSAACFEAFHYVEVVVRNAMDREMRVYGNEATSHIPWFLVPVVGKHQASFDEAIQKVRRRLRDQSRGRETRDQIIAGTDFGFWTSLLHSENEELWRHALHRAFPHSSGRRKDVVAVLERLRIFRNRLAHHDSLLNEDVSFRFNQMRQVLSWVDPQAEQWLLDVERVSIVLGTRPLSRPDTVVVAAKDAWPLYQLTGAYVCQAGRAFRTVEHLAFYADREIKREVAAIRHRSDDVDWSEAEAHRLAASANPDDRSLSGIIAQSRALGWQAGRYQLFHLSRPGEPGHVTPAAPIPHRATGKGSAFTQGQRYTRLDALQHAASTDTLR